MTVIIRMMEEKDVAPATRIFRAAFAKFIGLADPELFAPTCDVLRARRLMNPDACFVAERDGTVLGSNMATRWGSVGFFGPLTVDPSAWDQGLGKRLMEPVMEVFDRWGVRHAGLFTFPHSAKHLGLYQKFGFWPGSLTALFNKVLDASQPAGAEPPTYGALSESEKTSCLSDLRKITGAAFEGLDLSDEVRAVDEFKLGETVLLRDGSETVGFGVCHFGTGSEGGTIACYLKFGAVSPGPGAEERFGRLLRDCEAMARSRKLPNFAAGVSLGRVEAYQKFRDLGFRLEFQGVAMHRPHEPPYHRRGVFVVDDWR